MSLEGKAKTRIKSRLRKEWYWSKPRTEALKKAQTSKELNEYRCANCNGIFPYKKVQVDHVTPVVDPDLGWQGWDTYIDRMFCPVENLQILCKPCHLEKTSA